LVGRKYVWVLGWIFQREKKTYCSTKMESGPPALALISLKWQVRVGKFAANPRSGCFFKMFTDPKPHDTFLFFSFRMQFFFVPRLGVSVKTASQDVDGFFMMPWP
jgi:hypothetical protein